MKLYTIGHSNYTQEEFLNLLVTHNIDFVVDVRSVPASNHNPQFNQETLSAFLQGHDITYQFFGKELGARRMDCINADGQVDFEQAIHTSLFQQGIERIMQLPSDKKVALMCSEANPLECHETYELGDYSLMMVHPEGLSFHLDPLKNRAKYFMTFKYNGVVYDFTVTDPYFYQYIEQHPDAIEHLSDVYVTLSLGLEYEGRHHKLIAAIIIPSEASTINEPFLIRQETLREKLIRPFTSKERRACKRCFVVPSQQGFAVCMKMRDGKEQFITIDEGCYIKTWQVVNLKKAFLVTYENADGNEINRIRIPVGTKENVLCRILSFFLRKQN